MLGSDRRGFLARLNGDDRVADKTSFERREESRRGPNEITDKMAMVSRDRHLTVFSPSLRPLCFLFSPDFFFSSLEWGVVTTSS